VDSGHRGWQEGIARVVRCGRTIQTLAGGWAGAGVRRSMATLGLWALIGCAQPEKTDTWKSWEYDESQAQTTAQQFEAQRSLQGDPSAVTDPVVGGPSELLSNSMTEQERRAFQQQLVENMRARARQQAESAEAGDQGAAAARQAAGTGRGDR